MKNLNIFPLDIPLIRNIIRLCEILVNAFVDIIIQIRSKVVDVIINVMEKIRALQKQKGWSDAELIRRAGLAHSTLSSLNKRNNLPTISTLEAICTAFGITMSQFFNEYNSNELTSEQIEVLKMWDTLNDKQKSAIMELLKSI